jgi:hypothetical protein
MREITLSQGYVTRVSDAAFEQHSGFKWFAGAQRRANGSIWNVYAQRSIRTADGHWKTIKLHRAILNAPAGMEVDHIDGNGLNNIDSNLRLATIAQNRRNRRKPINSRNRSKGVIKILGNVRRPWRAQIMLNDKNIHLGYFVTEEAAAAAYDRASLSLHAEFGRRNKT